MRKVLVGILLGTALAAISGCGMNDYDPPNGVTIVTSPTPSRGVISSFPTTSRPTTTQPSTTTTVAPPPPPPQVVVPTVIVIPPPAVTTVTVAPPPPPARPASQTLATGSTLGRCGGTRLVMNMPIGNVPITLTASGLHFDATPSIPIESVIVQTTNPATSEFMGYILPLNRSRIGTGNGQSLDFAISASETVKSVTLCDTYPH